ncbi:type II toxin-antitoxin system RelE/ParE family toxin [Polynucleobacter sp. MWH-Adler-W8]|uniref:type II toxin-antitoxin system RelE/ParE family toxin n=1 Tax=Polynucleobacter sp. MWH-Adler-W8 TaxID=1819727 RepID=UPI0032AF7627
MAKFGRFGADLVVVFARVLFVLENNIMILIHGSIKKQQKTPKQDLDLAKTRVKQLRRSV